MPISTARLTLILGILVCLTALTYYHRYPTGDDAWFAEQSYWLMKQGVIRSEFFRGILGWETQLLVSHKLFLVFGAGLMAVFGVQLPVVQFVGLIFFVVIIAGLVVYVRRREPTDWLPYLLAVLILVFSNRLLIKLSFENRPELMVAGLGFWSFLWLQSARPTLPKAMLAGALAGLAMLCHLNGVIYLVAGFSTLVYLQKYKLAVAFAVVGGLTGLLYFADVVQANDGLTTWLYQFRNDPATQDAFGWRAKLWVMLTFPKLFFESPEQAALSVLLLFVVWQQRRFLRDLPVLLRVYSVVLVGAFWVITKQGSGSYLPLFMPVMLCMIYELYGLRPFMNLSLKLVLGLYFVIGLVGTGQLIQENLGTDYLPVSYRNLRPYIPKNQTGLVPLTFFFNEQEQYPRLLAHENANHLTPPTDNPSAQMAVWARRRGVGFIVMDYQYRPEAFYPKPGTPALPFYRLMHFDGRFAVYIRHE